ncbi:hypothetical protein DRQ33_08320 [bacterium]|nr:MAG: hypothetical protein DRQ33_08320 [bacterium]
MDNEQYLWYKLFCADGFGKKSINIIYESMKKNNMNIEELFDMNSAEFKKVFPELGSGRFNRANFQAIHNLDESTIRNEYDELLQNNISIVHIDSKFYPRRVKELPDFSPPPVLFCQGQLSLFNAESIAIVGARKCSTVGKNLAKQTAKKLAIEGKNVVSGYARGIDISAHLGALETGGTTTIVLGSGICEFSSWKISSQQNWKMNTLIISQFHPKMKWSGQNATMRNKLTCALSEAVVVIESGEEINDSGKRSGTFNTAKNALKMGIPLFVANFDQAPLGNRHLIELGGIPITPADAVPQILQFLDNKHKKRENFVSPQLGVSHFLF